ncbi:SUMF1/EgtB/PvdO family nonheme iron enzyme [bacterium]|nr:SUMF1/EgtB/PvdO family nonheme iron enzyme [bacterium]
MDLQSWKERIRERVSASAAWFGRATPGMTYGALSTASLMPLIAAAGSGDYATFVTLAGVVGGVGGNLIANQIQKWRDKDEAQLAAELGQLAESKPEWRDALDTLILELETPRIVQAILGEAEWDRFQRLLRDELAQLGNADKYAHVFTATVSGSGAVAQNGGVAAGAGGVAVRGKVEGGIHITHNYGKDAEKATVDENSLHTAYLNRIYRQAQALSLSGVDPRVASEADTRLELSAVYTGMLTQQTEGRDDLQSTLETRQNPKHISAVEQINRHQHLVLLGDPGSGKSTFVDFVALCLAGEALGESAANLARLTEPLPRKGDQSDEQEEKPQPQRWEHGALLPVRVVLRDFAATGLPPIGKDATAEDLWRFIASDIQAALPEYSPILRTKLRTDGGIILLDGLDEVPAADTRRTQIKQAVEDFAAVFHRCRILVTSRTYAYQQQDWRLQGFADTYLAPFTPAQIARFIERWYTHVGQLRHMDAADVQGRAALLKNAIEHSRRLQELAERPLLLTLMASLHAWRGGSLPEKREELYRDAVDLLLDWWESQRVKRRADGSTLLIQPSLAEFLKIDRDKMRSLLNRLAFDAHSSQPALVGTADIPESALVAGLTTLSHSPDIRHMRLVEYLRDRSGLLIPRGVGVYTFPHRTFQEYLAACHLTDFDYPDSVADLARKDPNRWREVALLAGAKAAGGASVAIWNLVEALCDQSPTNCAYTDAHCWGALLAGQALVESANLNNVSERNQRKLNIVKQGLLHVMRSSLPAIERAAAGRSLAKLGDPRVEVLDPTAIQFCPIPAGPFWMGEGKEEHLSKSVDYDFQISRYPITVAQFQAFVNDGGYTYRPYWKEAEAHGIWKAGKVKGRWDNAPRNCPERYGEPFYLPSHPTVGVSWYEALAFTRWLTEKLQAAGRLIPNQVVMLPSEAEWEKAARGGDRRIYQSDPECANCDATGIGFTNAVGCFPDGVTKYKTEEMGGNVWEWTRSLDAECPYSSDDAERQRREDLSVQERERVLRGGSFLGPEDETLPSFRFMERPYYTSDDTGFRVVVVALPFTSGL